jgi:PAS domain S-box-containing protein
VTRISDARLLGALNLKGVVRYALELVTVGLAYFGLAQFSLAAAFFYSGVIPIWAPAGLGLAAILLRGIRVWPAIFAAASVAGFPTDLVAASGNDSNVTSVVIAAGSTLAAVAAGYLINTWSHGRNTFDTPGDVAKFALVVVGTMMISAAVGVASLSVGGLLGTDDLVSVWATWWLRDVAGTLVVTPVVALWALSDLRKVLTSFTMLAAAGVAGVIAFSSLIEQTPYRSALALVCVLPLIWAALRGGPRDSATTALILSAFAAWGALAGTGPFTAATFHDSFLLVIAIVTAITLPTLAVSAEMTSRTRLESKLRQEEHNLRDMFSQALVGIAEIDAVGRFKFVNDQFCEVVGRGAPQLLQKRLEDIAAAEDAHYLRDLLDTAIQTGHGFAIELEYFLPNRSARWLRLNVSAIVDQRSTVGRLLVVVDDVTSRRRAEENLQRAHDDLQILAKERGAHLAQATELLLMEVGQKKRVEATLQYNIAERRKTHAALMESEWRFRMVIQGVTDYAIFMLDTDGQITNWNVGASRIHQYSAGEIVGQHFALFYSEEEQQRGEPARALQVAAYEGKCGAEGWRMRRDKSLFWASTVIEAVRDELGTVTGFVSITRDITEKREAQAALERAQEQLAQSQKMEALGQLTGSIAHDFNNLLMIVSGHAQLLRRRLLHPKQLQAIDAIHSAANRGESLTRQLLAFSRRQPLNPVVTNLKERVEAVRAMLVGSLRGNVELKCDISSDIWPVEVDIAELELALVNIAVNARDAMPGGGFITLSAQNVSLKKSDSVDQLEGDFVALAMTDTGVGIAPDVLPKIFEPFFTTKALGKGTGLGLAQVYGFSHQSGGTVVATSAVGSGTTITVYLPRKHASVVRTVEGPSTQPVVLGHGTVLVVEDNVEVADVTASLVEQLGYRTFRAETAADALNCLKRGDKIGLVLSDVVMPGGMNGVALAQEIGNHYPHIPVLLTSGYSDVVQTTQSHFPILRKPFELAALEKAIREVLERASMAQAGDDRVLQFAQWQPTARE